MDWNFDASRPLYLQLVEQMERRIAAGAIPPGGRLKSVRELAAEVEVNPNTMQRALAELERLGLVYSRRTNGRYVTEDGERIEEIRRELAEEQIKGFLDQMQQLGFDRAASLKMMEMEEETQ